MPAHITNTYIDVEDGVTHLHIEGNVPIATLFIDTEMKPFVVAYKWYYNSTTKQVYTIMEDGRRITLQRYIVMKKYYLDLIPNVTMVGKRNDFRFEKILFRGRLEAAEGIDQRKQEAFDKLSGPT